MDDKTEVERILERIDLVRTFEQDRKKAETLKTSPWPDKKKKWPDNYDDFKAKPHKVDMAAAKLTLYSKGKQTHQEAVVLTIDREQHRVVYGKDQDVVLQGPLKCDCVTIKIDGVPLEKDVNIENRNHYVHEGNTLTLSAGPDGFLSLS